MLALKHLLAIIGSILSYAIWYRMQVGPWCPAMWFGTAPPILMLVFYSLWHTILSKLIKNDDSDSF